MTEKLNGEEKLCSFSQKVFHFQRCRDGELLFPSDLGSPVQSWKSGKCWCVSSDLHNWWFDVLCGVWCVVCVVWCVMCGVQG